MKSMYPKESRSTHAGPASFAHVQAQKAETTSDHHFHGSVITTVFDDGSKGQQFSCHRP